MNATRAQPRRAATAKENPAPPFDRAGLIRLTLAAIAAAGAEGGTLILPDGEVLGLQGNDARAMAGTGPARGHA
jgi:hypothetical protein